MGTFEELRADAVEKLFQVMRTRRFVTLFQSDRVLDVLTEGMSARAKLRNALRAMGGDIARAFGLATLDDLHDLERQIRADRAAGGASPPGGRGWQHPPEP